MSTIDIDAIRTRAERSYDETIRICSVNSNNRPKMSIPANPDKDTDLILTATLGDVKDLIGEVERLTAERDARPNVTVERYQELNEWAKFQANARDGWEKRAREAELEVKRLTAEVGASNGD